MPDHPLPDKPHAVLISSFEGRADPAGLARCMQLTEQVCQQLHIGEEDRYAVQLAVEEACTNIVDHAYAGGAPGPLLLQFWLDQPGSARELILLIRDEAPGFDPNSAPAPDLSVSVEDRPIGGLGWFLIKNVMDAFEHTALTPTGNRLRLLKRLSGPSPAPQPS